MKKASAMIKRKAAAFLCCRLFLLIIFIENSSSSLNRYGLNDNELHFIHQEIDFLRNENRDQNIQIAVLKDMMIKSNQHDESFIQELDRRMKEHHPIRRLKRPYRLLPIGGRKGENDDDSNDQHRPAIPRFYGPPANCSDVMKLGYTLNGFYLVKPDGNSILDNENIMPVFCSFKQPSGLYDSSKVEKQIPHLNAVYKKPTGTGVHFQAVATYIPYEIVMKSKYRNIFFQETDLNMGEAFDNNTGFFKAPKSGVYRFSIQMTLGFIGKLDVVSELYHRSLKDISWGAMGTAVRSISINNKNHMFYGFIDTIMKLNRGEIVYLRFLNKEKQNLEMIHLTNPISFIGSLLEEVI